MKARETALLRPPFEKLCMESTFNLARRATCRRLQVGCSIYSGDFQRMLSWGFNGNAKGLPNDCDSDEPGRCGCVHAESNAIIKCHEPAETPKILICTDLPCVMCAKMIINLGGVKRVIYGRDYRIKDSLQLFTWLGIEAELYNSEKYKDGL